MKTKDIINMDTSAVMKLTKPELKKMLQQVNNVANIRLKKLENLSIEAPSIAGGLDKFSTRGKSLNELRAEYVRVVDFMKGKTSTIPGFKAYREEMNILTGGAMRADISTSSEEAEKETKMWNLFNRLKEVHPGKMMTIGSDPELFKKLKEEVDDNPSADMDELVAKTEDVLEDLYVEGVENNEGYEFTESDFII